MINWNSQVNKRQTLLFFIILAAIGLPTSGALASKLNGSSSSVPGSASSSAPGQPARAIGSHAPNTVDASMYFVPSVLPGSCTAPPNGGTVAVGCRFVLEMWVDTGSNNDATAQQSYLTYTYNLIQNARVSSLGTSCTLTSTVTPVLDTFDAVLQNEVCNGPNPCIFRQASIDPGSLAFASGALSNCPTGCGGPFEISQVGICAIAAGQAILHWQFSPPAPVTRDTELVSFDGNIISNPSLFTDYVINIVGSSPTPTNTSTSIPLTSTPTNTNTAVPATSTPTNTDTPIPPSSTPTASNTNTPIPPTSTSTNTDTPVPSTSTPTNTNTAVPTNTNTDTPIPSTSTPTNTNTAVPSSTNTNTPIPATDTPTNTNTSTSVPSTSTPTNTNTAVPSSTDTNTPIPATETATNTNTTVATSTPTNTNTAVPSSTNTNTPIPVTNTPTSTNTSTSIPSTSTPTNTNTAAPSSTRTNTAIPATATSTATPLDYAITPSFGATMVPGSSDTGNHCDNCTTQITLPFSFSFYGVSYSAANLSSNGNLQFSSSNASGINTCLPNASLNGPMLLYWDDLRTDQVGSCSSYGAGGCGIFTRVLGSAPNRILVVEWRTVYNNNTAQRADFELKLYEGRYDFDFVYGQADQLGTSVTIGVQNGTGPQNSQFFCSASGTIRTVGLGLMLHFQPITITSTPTRTNTRTPAPITSTPTRTATPATTVTPCNDCDIRFKKPGEHQDPVTLSCNPDGSLHWSATLINKPDHDDNPGCTLVVPYRASLEIKCSDHTPCKATYGDGWRVVRVQRGTVVLPARRLVTVSGDFCFPIPSGVERMHYEFALDSNRHECSRRKKSQDISPCQVSPTCPPSGPEFSDVPGTNPFAPSINSLASTGVVSGFGDGTFKPNAPINRGQVAKMVVIANGLRAVGGGQHFSDVPASNPYFTYVEAAYSQGVMSGYSDGTFRPYDNVTRGQIAKIVVQAAWLQLVTPAKPTFSDVPAGSPFYSYIETAYANGLLSGYSDGTFRAGNDATRAQVCTVVGKLMSSAQSE